MLLRIFLCAHFVNVVLSEWQIPVEYSLTEDEKYSPLGAIQIERLFDGNHTANFVSQLENSKLYSEMKNALSKNILYKVRVNQNGDHHVQGYNHPCLMLQSKLIHQFRLSVDHDHQQINSLTLFPNGVYVTDNNFDKCVMNKDIEEDQISFDTNYVQGVAIINTISELPVPDTLSYIQKLEKERIARQHGAQTDNRSFIQKYWMYIVAAFVFIVISNAAVGEQPGE